MNQNNRQHWRATVESAANEAHYLSLGCRAEEVHDSAIEDLLNLFTKLGNEKNKAIIDQDEDAANELLSWELYLQAIVSELSMWIVLKRGDPNGAWNHSVSAEMNYHLASRAHAWGTDFSAEDQVSRMNALQRLVFPKPLFASIGTLIMESRCSICQSIYGECDHLAGRAYMGNLATRVVVDAKLLEISLVEKPANKSARITAVPTEDGYRDFMSWRVIEAEKAITDSEPRGGA